jgi:hypothetical protein
VEGVSYDWVWYGEARDYYLSLSERDQGSLRERIGYLSQNPWPDWSTKEFVNDLPPDVLTALVRAGQSYHFILYADETWAIVYEVVQPWVFVIYNATPL